MCAIGRALMASPKMVLLDEPSMGLAPQIVEEVFEIVRDLNPKEGVTFLLAEQNTNMALRYADYGYILESGRIVMDGAAAMLRENEDVREFYLGTGSAVGRAQELSRREELQAPQALARLRGGTTMARADADALQPLLPLLRQLREIKGVQETTPGIFYARAATPSSTSTTRTACCTPT